jgi:hypothetical protein
MVTTGGRDSREKAQESQKTPDTRELPNLPTTFTPGILLRILRLFAAKPLLRSAHTSNAARPGPWRANAIVAANRLARFCSAIDR